MQLFLKAIFGLSIMLCPFLCFAQSDAYDIMLKGLYANTVETITPEKAKTLRSAQWLDTREKDEYQVSHIKDAQWVGYDTFSKKRLVDIPKTDTIIVYCSVGYRSEKIGEQLNAMGYQHVYNLYGGIFQWVNEENSVVDSENKVTDKVHPYSKAWGIWLNKGEKAYK